MAATCAQNMAPRDVNSHMTFLARNELYQTEKPYTTDFPVDEIEGAKMTNQIFDTQPVLFHDARVAKEPLTLDQNGFCFVKAKTSLQAEEATPEKTELMEQYLQEVADILRDKFPQYKEVKSLDFQVCRLLFTAVMISTKPFQRFAGGILIFPAVRSAEQSLPSRRQWPTRTSQVEEHSCVWPTSSQAKSLPTKTENSI